jgi:hypothetical protein
MSEESSGNLLIYYCYFCRFEHGCGPPPPDHIFLQTVYKTAHGHIAEDSNTLDQKLLCTNDSHMYVCVLEFCSNIILSLKIVLGQFHCCIVFIYAHCTTRKVGPDLTKITKKCLMLLFGNQSSIVQ